MFKKTFVVLLVWDYWLLGWLESLMGVTNMSLITPYAVSQEQTPIGDSDSMMIGGNPYWIIGWAWKDLHKNGWSNAHRWAVCDNSMFKDFPLIQSMTWIMLASCIVFFLTAHKEKKKPPQIYCKHIFRIHACVCADDDNVSDTRIYFPAVWVCRIPLIGTRDVYGIWIPPIHAGARRQETNKQTKMAKGGGWRSY